MNSGEPSATPMSRHPERSTTAVPPFSIWTYSSASVVLTNPSKNMHWMTNPVPLGAGGAGVAVGTGVGIGRATGVGSGVTVGVGSGVGTAVGVGSGVGVGVGTGAMVFIGPTVGLITVTGVGSSSTITAVGSGVTVGSITTDAGSVVGDGAGVDSAGVGVGKGTCCVAVGSMTAAATGVRLSLVLPSSVPEQPTANTKNDKIAATSGKPRLALKRQLRLLGRKTKSFSPGVRRGAGREIMAGPTVT